MNIHDVKKYLFDMQSKEIIEICPGDIVTVSEKITENKKTRIQKFQGIVISNTGSQLTQNILVRKKFHDFWIEKRFFLHSPTVDNVVIDTKGNSRRAVLSYLRSNKELSQKLKRLKK